MSESGALECGNQDTWGEEEGGRGGRVEGEGGGRGARVSIQVLWLKTNEHSRCSHVETQAFAQPTRNEGCDSRNVDSSVADCIRIIYIYMTCFLKKTETECQIHSVSHSLLKS